MMPASRQQYFQFIINGTEKIQIRIHSPQSTGQPIFRPAFVASTNTVDGIRYEKPPYTDFEVLLNSVTPQYLFVQTNSLEKLSSRGKLRIRNKKTTNVFRNITFELDGEPYGEVTIQHGAELCHLIGYEQHLLRYLKEGSIKSLKYKHVFNIHVTVASKCMANSPYIEVKTITPELILQLSKVVKTRLKNRKGQIIARRTILENNPNKLAQGADTLEQISISIEKEIEKRTGKEAAQIVAQKVAIVSDLLGVFAAESCLVKGDITGAFAGVFGNITNPGITASAVFDLDVLKKEIAALQKEKEIQILLQNIEIAEIMEQNRIIRWELSQILPESPIYGCGNLKYFDESDFANVDDISKIHVRCGWLIDGIQVEYRCGGKANYHGGYGGQFHTFSLDPDERIISVGGTIYDVEDKWQQLSSITFETDCGRRAHFGKSNEKEFSFDMTDGSYLAAIKGYDLYPGNTEIYHAWDTLVRVVPALGFIAKF